MKEYTSPVVEVVRFSKQDAGYMLTYSYGHCSGHCDDRCDEYVCPVEGPGEGI